MAKILPMIWREARAIHTARQTSQLQRMPRVSASRKLKLTLAYAVRTIAAARPPSASFHRPVK